MKRHMSWYPAALTVMMVMMFITTSFGADIISGIENHQTVDQMALDSCGGQLPGDLDNDGNVGYVQDIALLIDFLCHGGLPPVPLANGDVNGDCIIDYADAVCLYNPQLCTPVECTCVDPAIGSCDPCDFQYPGDVDNTGQINISDLTYLVSFVFQGGPAPYPVANGDVDGSCSIDVADVTYLTASLFQGGPAPVDCTCPNPEWSSSPSVSLEELTEAHPILRRIVSGRGVGMDFQLEQNRPNPFNPSTQISFDLAAPSHVTLEIYNVAGQRIRTLLCRAMPAGHHEAVWDGRDDNTASVSSGIYLYKLTADGMSQSRRMLLLK